MSNFDAICIDYSLQIESKIEYETGRNQCLYTSSCINPRLYTTFAKPNDKQSAAESQGRHVTNRANQETRCRVKLT